MKVVKKVKDERAEGGGDIWGCTINQAIVAAVPNSFLCGKKYLAYGACKLPRFTTLCPRLCRSAYFHCKDKISDLSVNNVACQKIETRTMNQNGGASVCVWVGGFGTSDFQLSTFKF